MENDNVGNIKVNINTVGLMSIPGKWILVAIVINSKGASSNVLKIYDDVSGEMTPEKRFATIDTTASIGRLRYGVPIWEGLNLSCELGTAGDYTIIYRPMPASH